VDSGVTIAETRQLDGERWRWRRKLFA